jgi:hypothetical protein
MENTTHNVNLTIPFRNHKTDRDLQTLTTIICRTFITNSVVISILIKNESIAEYKHKLSELMRVYNPMDFYILWGSTVDFLYRNGITVKY